MTEAILILALIVFNGILSMAEAAMLSSRKSKLAAQSENGDQKARNALRMLQQQDVFLSTVQIGVTLVGILSGIFSGASITRSFTSLLMRAGIGASTASAISHIIVVLIVTYFMILFGELLPKRIALSRPEKITKGLAPLMTILSKIASPFVHFLAKSTAFFAKLLGVKHEDSKVTEDEIRSIVDEGTDDGVVSPVEQDIVERVFTLGDLSVGTIMTLRDDIVCVDVNDSEADIVKTIENSIFELYPVVDGDMDHVIGVLSIKDYVRAFRMKTPFNVRKMMHKPDYVHENMSVYSVLAQMNKSRIHRALVCDEFGSLTGIISLKDILDALVGNDVEQNKKDPDIIARKDGESWLVDGQCSIFDFLTYFDQDDNIEEFDFATVGGLILEQLEHVPQAGEDVTWKGFSLEVVDMDGARIDKVLVKLIPPADSPESD
ncbi:MAG: HlyC/CorC family transporter [Bacteroidales bacterium]|nr:HlyC/CorC family transporter [Bacteroidales bacterium]